jgi:hypothetical protein
MIGNGAPDPIAFEERAKQWFVASDDEIPVERYQLFHPFNRGVHEIPLLLIEQLMNVVDE